MLWYNQTDEFGFSGYLYTGLQQVGPGTAPLPKAYATVISRLRGHSLPAGPVDVWFGANGEGVWGTQYTQLANMVGGRDYRDATKCAPCTILSMRPLRTLRAHMRPTCDLGYLGFTTAQL